ncbi:MAG: hypothetical protein QW650_09320, partial [Thermofilum sp.]
IASEEGLPLSALREELEHRKFVLDWLVERQVTDFRRVSKLVRDFALRPSAVYAAVERGVYDL